MSCQTPSRDKPDRQLHRRAGLVAVGFLCVACAAAHAAEISDQAVAAMSIEELLAVKVTSVAKRAQTVSNSAAAVYVLRGEEIRRSGARSIPDALRLVPGVQVAAVDASRVGLSVRGFNTIYANKLLVLIDGRTIYTPIFSGVFWESQDLPVEDIERIEVVRGPGATLWGANAVNGVINIITKCARESQDRFIQVGGGSEDRAFGSLRYARATERSAFRVSGKYARRDDSGFAPGSGLHDDWQLGTGTLRYDFRRSEQSRFVVRGGYYDGDQRLLTTLNGVTAPYTEIVSIPNRLAGGHLLGRWKRQAGEGAEFVAQAYANRDLRENRQYRIEMRVFDLDGQVTVQATRKLGIIAGLGYRINWHEARNTEWLSVHSGAKSDHLHSGFVQADWDAVPDRARLTVGTKFEHTERGGSNWQPSVRGLWHPHERHSVWAAVSRAVRTPSVFEQDGRFAALGIAPVSPKNPGPLPILVTFEGTPGFSNESEVSYEAGYRVRPAESLNLDAAIFHSDYQEIGTTETGQPEMILGPVPYIYVPIRYTNGASAKSSGFELAVDWQPAPAVRLRSGYTALRFKVDSPPISGPDLSEFVGPEDYAPRQQAFVRGSIDLAHSLDLDADLRWIDARDRPGIRGYAQGDARLAYRPRTGLEVAVIGSNLLRPGQTETRSEADFFITQRQRAVSASLTTSF